MQLYSTITSLFLASLLAACNTMPNQPAGTNKDLTQILAELKYNSNHGLIDAYEIPLLNQENPGKINIEGVNEYRRWWCTLLSQEEINKHIQVIGNGQCKKLAGDWDGKWCTKNGNDPIFYIETGNLKPFIASPGNVAPYCTSGRVFAVIASTSEASNLEAWRARAVKAYHFQTKAEVAELKQKEAAKTMDAKLRMLDEKKFHADSIKFRGTGSRVCKKSGTYAFFTGFVEQFEKDRMQIRVVDKLTSGFSQNGFTPIHIWDEVGNWYPCDTKTERELLPNQLDN